MKSTLLIVLLAAVAVGAQTPQGARDANRPPTTGTAGISGVVTADEAGKEPVRRVLVTANRSDVTTGPTATFVALTDDRGRFAFPNLPAGRFTVMATKGGWITAWYGSKRPGRGPGQSIALNDGEHVRADVRLMRGAVIAGRIIDENGHPQLGVRPQLLEYRVVSGQRRLLPAPLTTFSLFSTTNDLGEYRLYAVPPGSYVLAVQPGFQSTSAGARQTTPEEVRWATQLGAAATSGAPVTPPPPGPAVTYAPVYFPGVADSTMATLITVGAGEERQGIDIVMTLVATARLEGVVTRPDGQPARGTQINVVPARADAATMTDSGARPVVDPQGRFTIPAIRPGQYVIMARAPSQLPAAPKPGAPMARSVLDLWGAIDVTVSGQDMQGLSIALQPGLTVSGRFAFEASTLKPPEAFATSRIMMMSPSMADIGITGSVSAAQMSSMFMSPASADGSFTLTGVVPGRYLLTANVPVAPGSPPGSMWMMKSVTARGQVASEGFDIAPGEALSDVVITFTDRVGEVSGTLTDAANRPAPEYFVFVFPADKSAWTPLSSRMRPAVKPASNGSYRLTGLLPGEYYVAALTDFEQENLYDTAFLEQVAAAAFKITLAEGEKKVQDLRIK